MVRECVALSFAALLPACSLILDFDEAPPADASIDGPFTQAECAYKEPNESITQAALLEATDTGPAAICAATPDSPEDHDFYTFMAVNATVTVGIQFTNRPGGDLDMKLYDMLGSTLAQSRGFGDGEMITCPGASPSCAALTAGAMYVIEVFPAIPGSVNSYTISLAP